MRKGALAPNDVMPVSAAIVHNAPRSGERGVAVEQHDGRADQEARHEQVPHHPTGGREPEEPVARAEVVMRGEELRVLEQDAAVAVHDRLRQARRPGREQHVERMLERHGLELEWAALGDEFVPTDRAIGRRRVRVEVRQHHRRLDRRQRGTQFRNLVVVDRWTRSP